MRFWAGMPVFFVRLMVVEPAEVAPALAVAEVSLEDEMVGNVFCGVGRGEGKKEAGAEVRARGRGRTGGRRERTPRGEGQTKVEGGRQRGNRSWTGWGNRKQGGKEDGGRTRRQNRRAIDAKE